MTATIHHFPAGAAEPTPSTWTDPERAAGWLALGLPPEQVRALGFPLTEETLAGMTLAGMDAVMEASRQSLTPGRRP